MNSQIIFVGGVHGVGKNYLIQNLMKAIPFQSYSSSELIKNQKKAKVDNDKIVINPNRNQDCLIKALGKVPSKSPFFLDGHFCLQSDSGLYEIEKSIFDSISPKIILLIVADSNLIHKRLLARDNSKLSLSEINTLQESEVNRAEFISKKLGIPIHQGESGNTEYFIDHIRELFF